MKNKIVTLSQLQKSVFGVKNYVDDTAETLVAKDINKYKLITCDDPLVIAKSDITDIADATITIDNLTGQFGNLVANEDGTWTYTLNTIMTDVETFTFTVGETTQDLVIVPYREMKYNDDIGGITYPTGDVCTIENNDKFYKSTAHFIYNSTNSQSIDINFKGTGIIVYSGIFDSTTTSVAFRLYDKNDNIMSTKVTNPQYSDGQIYNESYCKFDNFDYGEYRLHITIPKNIHANIGSIEILGSLGYNINENINKLYSSKDNSLFTSVLRTDKVNAMFNPKKPFDPATKKYVDDNRVTMCTDEEITAMLTEVLGAGYSATE